MLPLIRGQTKLVLNLQFKVEDFNLADDAPDLCVVRIDEYAMIFVFGVYLAAWVP